MNAPLQPCKATTALTAAVSIKKKSARVCVFVCGGGYQATEKCPKSIEEKKLPLIFYNDLRCQ